MKRIDKSEVLKLMADLKEKYTNEEIAVMLERSSQTVWTWSSPTNTRIPCRSDYEVMKRLLVKK